eukprot:1372005-Rhodomonas_salina.1
MPGTDLACGATTSLHSEHGVSCYEVASPIISSYALAMRCPVARSRMLLPACALSLRCPVLACARPCIVLRTVYAGAIRCATLPSSMRYWRGYAAM